MRGHKTSVVLPEHLFEKVVKRGEEINASQSAIIAICVEHYFEHYFKNRGGESEKQKKGRPDVKNSKLLRE